MRTSNYGTIFKIAWPCIFVKLTKFNSFIHSQIAKSYCGDTNPKWDNGTIIKEPHFNEQAISIEEKFKRLFEWLQMFGFFTVGTSWYWKLGHFCCAFMYLNIAKTLAILKQSQLLNLTAKNTIAIDSCRKIHGWRGETIYKSKWGILVEMTSVLSYGILGTAQTVPRLRGRPSDGTTESKRLLLLPPTQNLMEAFHCWQPESRQVKIVHLVSRLVTFEVAATGGQDGQPEFPIHYMGSQIVQTLLHFNKPIKLVQSLLETETAQLKDMACDPCGSFIIDAFVASEHVGEKSREKLIHKLQVRENLLLFFSTLAHLSLDSGEQPYFIWWHSTQSHFKFFHFIWFTMKEPFRDLSFVSIMWRDAGRLFFTGHVQARLALAGRPVAVQRHQRSAGDRRRAATKGGGPDVQHVWSHPQRQVRPTVTEEEQGGLEDQPGEG